MKYFRLLVLILPLLLTACGLSEQQKADYAAVQRAGVNSATYNKMLQGMDLSLYDVKALAKAGVNSGIVLRYMQNQGTIYVLNAGDIQGLLNAGVSRSVVDYMISTPRLYQAPPVTVGVGVGYWGGPYWGGGYYPGPYCYPYRRGYCR